MVDVINHSVEYFKAHPNYFWRWSDKGEVIEWKNGATICYRDDLVSILGKLTSQGFPPLGSILMVIACCHENFHQSGAKGILSGLAQTLKNYKNTEPDREGVDYHLHQALKLMDLVAGLPRELRTGSQRIFLIQQIFEPSTLLISETPLSNLLDEFNSGRLDNLVFAPWTIPIQAERFKTDLQILSQAAQKFSSSESLILRLRTGLDKIPGAIETVLPIPIPADLFDVLAQDQKTAGVARLAKRLIAVLNIPLHSQGSGDQSYGGISDITNRGNYDKLLLSELAQDDLLLMARLVNNEALYFRREEPPDNPKKQRTILLDTSIRMWGIPRVFAFSAALACSQNIKHNELVEAYALGGKHYQEIDLLTKEGVINALESLDHSLHCGGSLHAVIKEIPALEQNEYFLITEARQFESPDFQFFYSAIKESLQFIITVSRDGEIKFHSCRNGITKLLTRAKIDLEELLFTPATDYEPDHSVNKIPAFIEQRIAPLFFPPARINSNHTEKMADLGTEGMITITETQRVLWWHNVNKGAREILTYIEKGKYFFGLNPDGWLYIFVNNYEKKLQKLYKFNILDSDAAVITNIQIPPANDVIFLQHRFMVQPFAGFVDFSIHSYDNGDKIGTMSYEEYHQLPISNLQNIKSPNASKILQYVPNNYNIMFNAKRIGVSNAGLLVVGKHHLRVSNNNVLKFADDIPGVVQKVCKEIVDIKSILPNRHVKFRKAIWEDGSIAIIDSRGFIHLQSSNKSIPEITIALILGRATACWNSDGVACGADFLTSDKTAMIIPVRDFNMEYLQPFIDHLS